MLDNRYFNDNFVAGLLMDIYFPEIFANLQQIVIKISVIKHMKKYILNYIFLQNIYRLANIQKMMLFNIYIHYCTYEKNIFGKYIFIRKPATKLKISLNNISIPSQ